MNHYRGSWLLTKQDKSLMPFYAKFNKCPLHVNCNLYKSMNCLIIEFASPAWDPYTLLNVNKLESIQSSAARFCLKFNNYIFSNKQHHFYVNLFTLKQKRFRSKNVVMHKRNKFIDIYTHCYFVSNYYSTRKDQFTQLLTRVDLFFSTLLVHLTVFVTDSPSQCLL